MHHWSPNMLHTLHRQLSRFWNGATDLILNCCSSAPTALVIRDHYSDINWLIPLYKVLVIFPTPKVMVLYWGRAEKSHTLTCILSAGQLHCVSVQCNRTSSSLINRSVNIKQALNRTPIDQGGAPVTTLAKVKSHLISPSLPSLIQPLEPAVSFRDRMRKKSVHSQWMLLSFSGISASNVLAHEIGHSGTEFPACTICGPLVLMEKGRVLEGGWIMYWQKASLCEKLSLICWRCVRCLRRTGGETS